MNFHYVVIASSIAVISISCVQAQVNVEPAASSPPAVVTPHTQEEKVNYILGVNIGNQFKINAIPFDNKSFAAGLDDGIEGKKSKLTQQQTQETMLAFQLEMKKQQQLRERDLAEKRGDPAGNRVVGQKFLMENGRRPSVVTSKTGLQYEVLAKGSGAIPHEDDKVTVHYQGTLLDGTEFDSSYKRNEPATFLVSAVIPWLGRGTATDAGGFKMENLDSSRVSLR